MIKAAARAALAVLVLAGGGAGAAEPRAWRVDPEASVIRFDYDLAGRAASGRFRKVTGSGRFDPARPADTRLELLIEVESLDLGDPLWNAFALTGQFFDATDHPVARYRLARLTPLPDGRWEALGDLTLRGVLKILRTPVTLTLDADVARAQGRLDFDRRDFGVGTGPVAAFLGLGPDVTVDFDLSARPDG